MKESEKEIIRKWLTGFGVPITEVQLHLLDVFITELWEWNRKMNLTGLPSRERIVKELLLDSLLPSSFLPDEGRLLDIGSGAGFPAVPLKICRPGLQAHLIEVNFRKTVFLKQVIRRTQLDGISVIRGRLEDPALPLAEKSYQVITSRAMSGLIKTISIGSPFLAPGGLLVAFAGNRIGEALREGFEILKEQGLKVYESVRYTVPGKKTARNLLLFQKTPR